MAATPVFYPDRDTLMACVRMQDMSADANTQVMVDRAIQTVRNGLYVRLGLTRITSILVTPFTETPSTDLEVTRSRAQMIECNWFHAELLVLLPTLFAASGSSGIDIYQGENPFRLNSSSAEDQLSKKLMAFVNEELEGIGAAGVVTQFNASRVDPECPAPILPDMYYEPSIDSYVGPSD